MPPIARRGRKQIMAAVTKVPTEKTKRNGPQIAKKVSGRINRDEMLAMLSECLSNRLSFGSTSPIVGTEFGRFVSMFEYPPIEIHLDDFETVVA
jgi:hypothetical protein